MFDLTLTGLFEFSATSVEISAHTQDGREFLGDMTTRCGGVDPVSAKFQKSAIDRVMIAATRAGLTVEQS